MCLKKNEIEMWSDMFENGETNEGQVYEIFRKYPSHYKLCRGFEHDYKCWLG